MLNFLKKNYLIIAILIIATFFRLYNIGGYMEFLGDQGRDVSIIRDFLKNGNLFFIGPQTSVGNMYLGPYFYYLIAPALLLANFNPIGPAIFIALIGIATVFLIFFVSKKWFDLKTAYIASFLYAISPVTIKYSNFIWNPNIMPFFSLLFVYFFFESFKSKKYRYLIYAFLAFVMVINSHYLGLVLLPFIGLFWLYKLIKFIKSKSTELKPLLINTLFAIIIFIMSLTPQILFDIKHDGQNINSILSFFNHSDSTINIKPFEIITKIPLLFNQINTRLLAGKNETVGLIISIVFIIGLILIILKKKNKKTSFPIPFFWYLSGLICLVFYKQYINDHYFTFLFPVVFILIAYLISKNKFIGIPLFILITIFSLLNNPFRWPPNNQLNHAYNLAKTISEHNQDSDGKFNIVLLASYNDYRGIAPRYFLENNFPSNNFLNQEKYQEAETLYIILDDSSKWPNGVNSDIWEINASGKKKIVDEFNSSDNTKIFKLIKN